MSISGILSKHFTSLRAFIPSTVVSGWLTFPKAISSHLGKEAKMTNLFQIIEIRHYVLFWGGVEEANPFSTFRSKRHCLSLRGQQACSESGQHGDKQSQRTSCSSAGHLFTAGLLTCRFQLGRYSSGLTKDTVCNHLGKGWWLRVQVDSKMCVLLVLRTSSEKMVFAGHGALPCSPVSEGNSLFPRVSTQREHTAHKS